MVRGYARRTKKKVTEDSRENMECLLRVLVDCPVYVADHRNVCFGGDLLIGSFCAEVGTGKCATNAPLESGQE